MGPPHWVARPHVTCHPSDAALYHQATAALDGFGRGGHPAKLNVGDCMSYAGAKHYNVPLLYKGRDFSLTDILPARP